MLATFRGFKMALGLIFMAGLALLRHTDLISKSYNIEHVRSS